MRSKVYVVDDLEASRALVQRLLDRDRFEVETFASVRACLARLGEVKPGMIITDLRMPELDGIEGVRRFHAAAPEVPVVVMTAYATVETAVRAMKEGAFDYLRKPFEPSELEVAVERALAHRALVVENRALRSRVSALTERTLIAHAPAMRRLLRLVAKIAPTDATVLIEGESGTGKEVIARELHAQSRRSAGPFLAINCAAIPETLLESELFGYERGAFSGAQRRSRGFFAEAGGGTLLLDEIGEMPLAMQPKLLRVLEDGEFYAIGSRQAQHADARILCSTNRDLGAAVRDGMFREDLFYRINVLSVRIPPLRDRPEDVEPLARHFARKRAAAHGLSSPPELSPALLGALRAHRWPGNVRELENAMERAVLLGTDAMLSLLEPPGAVRDAGLAARAAGGPAGSEAGAGLLRLPVAGGYHAARTAFERAYFSELLRAADGNVTRAAEAAQVHRSTLYARLAKLGIAQPEQEPS